MQKKNDKSKKLNLLLSKFPITRDMIIEALETDHFFITITCQKKLDPNKKDDLAHYWFSRRMQKDDVNNSLKHIRIDYLAKEAPHLLDEDPEKGGGMH